MDERKNEKKEPAKTLEEKEIQTLDERDLKVIKGSWGCAITWNHRSLGSGGSITLNPRSLGSGGSKI